MRGCSNQRYFIEAPDGTLLIPPGNIFPCVKNDGAQVQPMTGEDKVWRWSHDSYLNKKDQICIKKGRSSNLVDADGKKTNWNVFTKTYLKDVIKNSSAKPNSLIENHINQNSSHELKNLEIPFSFAKPSSLIEYLMEISLVRDDDIVLDFFAGSGTTGEAVMQFNVHQKKNVSYILMQLPEKLDPNNKDHKAGVSFCEKLKLSALITEISKERIRRAGLRIQNDIEAERSAGDIGMRVLKIDTSNMKDVYYRPDAITQQDLYGQIDNIKPDRSGEDLLFQVMLDWGLDLALPIAAETIAGKTVYFVDGDDLAACFEAGIDEEFVKQLAQRKPLRAVFRDTGYGSDNTKINVAQIFRLISPNTDVKSI